VSKHTTCSDVDEGGLERLVEVPGCRCLHRDVDVGAVLLGTNKVRKNRNPNTHVNSQKFGAKELTNVVKICVKIMPDFCVKGTIGCQKGIMVLKWSQKLSRPALAGVTASYFQTWAAWKQLAAGAGDAVRAGAKRERNDAQVGAGHAVMRGYAETSWGGAHWLGA
jgi:hypothetical protein